MKRVLLTMIIIAVLLFGIILACNITSKMNQFNNSDAENEELTIMDQNEITIYDIEEGYLKVPYNKLADKHSYNWDNGLKKENGFYYYEDENYKSIFGLDLSNYQEEVDWEKLKSEGVEFVILRVGYRGYGSAGNIVIDSMFEEHYKNAINNGMYVGVYFFSQAINTDEVKEEADTVLECIKGKNIMLPVFFDLEKIKNDSARTDNLTLEEINEMSLEFCKIIKENGYEPGIYGNSKTFTTKMKLEEFNDYFKWYADYLETPLYPYEFSMWQYTETGHIDGIDGNVDFNIYFDKKTNYELY